jgi:predicted RNase H-like HicB family nuclease
MARKPASSYIAILVPEKDDGGYSVFFPDLPGCVTQGDDVADAQAMAIDALSGWLAVTIDLGYPVPIQRPLEAIRADKSFARENEVNWRDAIAMVVPVRPPLGRPERVNVSLDSNRLRAIDAYAQRRGMTRSAVLEAGADLLLSSDPFPGAGLSERTATYRSAAVRKRSGASKNKSRRTRGSNR